MSSAHTFKRKNPADYPAIKLQNRVEYFLLNGNEIWDVSGIKKAIVADPKKFTFLEMPIAAQQDNVRVYDGIDQMFVKLLQREDTRSPVLMISYADGKVRMIDGYHRTYRAMQLGEQTMACWLLTADQSKAFLNPPALVAAVRSERLKLKP